MVWLATIWPASPQARVMASPSGVAAQRSQMTNRAAFTLCRFNTVNRAWFRSAGLIRGVSDCLGPSSKVKATLWAERDPAETAIISRMIGKKDMDRSFIEW